MDTFTHGLVALGRPDTFAYLRPPGTWGYSNSGLILDGHTGVLVDAAYTVEMTATMREEIAAALPGLQIDRIALTHGNGDHCFGLAALGDIEVLTARSCAETIEHEVSPDAMRHLIAHGSEPMRAYLAHHFGHFDFTGAVLPTSTAVFDGRMQVRVGRREIELIEVGPAHSPGDLIVNVPDAAVAFAGDIVFAHDTPIAWTSVQGVIDACHTLRATGAEQIVPGHGPIVGPSYLDLARGYFEDVLDHAVHLGTAGVPYQEAARRMPLKRYASWQLPERIVLSMNAAYRDLGLPTDGPLGTIEHMARFAGLEPQ